MSAERYWIAVVSKDHTMRGVVGGFMQVCHGKEAPLKRMRPNDWVIFYSPKLSMNGDEKCQSFTAIGRVANERVYQFQMAEDFIPHRRDVNFYQCDEVSILPMIDELSFIQNKKSWGYPFRFGFLEITESDFNKICVKMLENYAGE